MPDFNSVVKDGWHPKGKDGGKESWRGDFKGIDQVAGWMGKKKDTSEQPNEHVSRPLTTLKDPSAFGPPPKNVNYHGGSALPNQVTPDKRGWGAPLSQDEIQAKKRADEEAVHVEEEAKKLKGLSVPYRPDTTGLSTTHLPLPPGRKDGADARSQVTGSKPKPSLPPRLPPRQTSSSASVPAAIRPAPISKPTVAEPPAHKGIMNQGSLDRLGAAGVSIPGFGIGGKESLLSPPRSPAISPQPRVQSPATKAAPGPQINELQTKFSRLGNNSSSAEAPAKGTSFAEKQAAFKTAQSFHNDPSSVSFSDARNAASTANNFRERHGDQVASGWKSANKFNTKYGLSEKAGQYASPSMAASQASVEAPSSSQIPLKENTVPFKKPPPPPPKKKPGLNINADTGDGPPPIPLTSKPKLNETRNSHPERQNLDLDLSSLWFAKSPILFPPPSIQKLPGSRGYASSSGWSSMGARKTYTFTGIIRHNVDLSTTKIHLTWDGSNPGLSVKAEQKQIPPPRPLSTNELEDYREMYSDRIASWCESKMGQQVGNGECWTLAHEALKAVAAQSQSRGQEPCMSSQGVVHGSVIFSFIPPKPCEPPGGVEAAGVARGDIAQFLSAHFKAKNGMSESWAGSPDHTAVITSVERGGILRVVESNAGGVKTVRQGKYDFSELVAGEIRIFRAVGESWIGPLDPTWP